MISIVGYAKEMAILQLRHFPFKRKKLSTGMLSQTLIFFLQTGQWDEGFRIDLPEGKRCVQTPKKLPNTSPKTEKKNHPEAWRD